MNGPIRHTRLHQKLRPGDRLLVGSAQITVKRTSELTLLVPSDIPVTRDESGRKRVGGDATGGADQIEKSRAAA